MSKKELQKLTEQSNIYKLLSENLMSKIQEVKTQIVLLEGLKSLIEGGLKK